MRAFKFCHLVLTFFCAAALDLPGLNAKAVAEAYGCPAFRADTPAAVYEAVQQARKMKGPVLIECQINPKLEPLPA